MQKVSKQEKAKRELQERLKRSAHKHGNSPLDSNPLIAQARAMLRPNFGIGSSSEDVRIVSSSELENPKREIQGAESRVSQVYFESLDELAPNELAPNELAPNELAPNELAPNELAPNELAPNELAPNELAPNELASQSAEFQSNYRALVRDDNWLFAAHTLFSGPRFSADFSKPEEWLQAYLLKKFGMKRYLPIKLCLELYKKAQASRLEIVCLNRQDLAKALGTGSNSSVTRSIKWGTEMGLFESVSLTCRKGVLQAGTYFRIKFPWNGML